MPDALQTVFPGGLGGDQLPGIRDLRLVRKAIEGGWNLSPEQRKTVVQQMMAVLDGPAKERDKIQAAKCLVAADALDLRAESLNKPAGPVNFFQQNNVNVSQDDEDALERDRAFLRGVIQSIRNSRGNPENLPGLDGSEETPNLEPNPGPTDGSSGQPG